MLIVFDIDGTLANNEHRLHYVRNCSKMWKEYDNLLMKDTVIQPVKKIFDALASHPEGHDIAFLTGRSEHSRKDTVTWLKHNDLFLLSAALYMRKEKDYRPDNVIKAEFVPIIQADYGRKIDMVFEDRPRVVNMWKDLGIFVLNVYQGNEDF